jgi:signal transduction histidine kinase
MGVRWRWTLVLAAAVMGLMLVAGIGLESTLRARIGAESRAWEEARIAQLDREFISMAEGLEAGLSELESGDGLAGAFAQSDPTDAQRRAREDFVVVRARRAEIDELLVLDAAGRVLACSAHPERAGSIHPVARDLVAILPRTGLVWREQVEGDAERSNWRLSAAEDALLPSGRVRLVASTILDETTLDRLREQTGLGSLRFGPPSDDEESFLWPVGIEVSGNANLAVSGGLSPGLGALRSLRAWLFAAVGVALLIGFAGAPWIAAGFGRPLEEMSAAVDRIGRGARSIELEPAGPPELRRLQRALRQLVRDLKETEERVRQAERQATRSELARHIAHEIRNVLSPLALALDNVETGVDRDRSALDQSLAVARDQLESLRRLASEFSENAREPEARFGLVVIDDLVDAVAQTARAAFAGVDLRLERENPPDSVDGDAEQLRRALHNLIKNAVEVASGEPITLRCGSPADESRWWIEIEDRGPGLPGSVAETLGAQQVSTRTGGSGLGLAIVSQVAAAHGGTVAARTGGGGGTILRLDLSRRPNGQGTGDSA